MRKIILLFIISATITSCGGRRSKQVADEQGVVINGVRWATRNVDAPGTFAEFPESSGMLFQWNRRKGWNAADEYVEGWDGSVPEGASWSRVNDPCPVGWRVPTATELQGLVDAGSVWITHNGINGRLFGTAPNQIFLPAVGFRCMFSDGELILDRTLSCIFGMSPGDTAGHYWSSTRYGDITTIVLGTYGWVRAEFLGYGFSVRCVAE